MKSAQDVQRHRAETRGLEAASRSPFTVYRQTFEDTLSLTPADLPPPSEL